MAVNEKLVCVVGLELCNGGNEEEWKVEEGENPEEVAAGEGGEGSPDVKGADSTESIIVDGILKRLSLNVEDVICHSSALDASLTHMNCGFREGHEGDGEEVRWNFVVGITQWHRAGLRGMSCVVIIVVVGVGTLWWEK